MSRLDSSTRRRLTELINNLQTHFTRNPRLRFEKILGIGRHGGTLAFREFTDYGELARKLVIKFSLGQISPDAARDADEDLRNEYRWLELLRGAEHIVQLVYLADTSLEIPGVSDGNATAGGVAPGERITPTFASEYLPNGTVGSMCQRIAEAGQYLPNRFIWRVFLCMVRQCVAMAYPPRGDWNTPPTRERIIWYQQYFDLTQNSCHLDNVMFDDLEPGDTEHGLVPKTKLIDFGRGKLEGKVPILAWGYAIAANLTNAAQTVTEIAFTGRNVTNSKPPIQYEYTDAAGIPVVILTDAPAVLAESKQMDLRLRDLLCRCYAHSVLEVPLLQHVLAECERAVQHQTENMVVADVSPKTETDEVIRRRVQRFILDADI